MGVPTLIDKNIGEQKPQRVGVGFLVVVRVGCSFIV